MTERLSIELEGKRVGGRRSRGRGPAIVLAHGAGGNADVFGPLIDALEGREVVALSLPGRAASAGPPLESVEAMAAFVSRAVDALELGPHVLAGHSLGGAITIECALRASRGEHRGLVGIALLATGARLRVNPVILQIMRQAAETGVAADADRVVFSPGTDPSLIERTARARVETPPSTALVDWLAANAFDRMDALGDITVPALVLGGRDDALTAPKYAEYLADHISGAELVFLEGTGHMFPLERAAETARHLVAFAEHLAP